MTTQYSPLPGGHCWVLDSGVRLEITGVQLTRSGQVYARVTLLAPDDSVLSDGRIDLSNEGSRYGFCRGAASRNGGTAAEYSDILLSAWLAVQERLSDSEGAVQGAGPPPLQPLDTFLAGVSPHADWLVEDLLELGSLYLVGARYKIGKSLLAMNLIVAVRLGGRWLNRNVSQGAVAWFQLEDGERTIKRRWAKMCQGQSPQVAIVRGPWRLTEENLQATVQVLQGKALVVVDPIISALEVGKWSDMGEVRGGFDLWRQVARQTNSVVLLVAHHRKAAGEEGEQIAGSHQAAATVDGIIEVRKGGALMDKNERRLEFLFRDLPDLDDQIVALNPDNLTFEPRGSLQDRQAAAAAEQAEADVHDLATAVMDDAEMQSRLQDEVLHWSGARFSAALMAAQVAGRVHRERRPNPATGRQVYYVVFGPSPQPPP
jgi:hypothetical protein